MAQQFGPITWNLGETGEKQKLTPEVIDAKTAEITNRLRDLFIAFGLGVSMLADEGDALGLLCLSTIVKSLLADGADRCGDAIDKAAIIE